MPDIVGVRFKKCGKIYDFEVNGIDAGPGMRVVVESEMGLSLGIVVIPRHSIGQPEQSLKKVLRIATDEDIDADKSNLSLGEEARDFCIGKVKNRNLPMKIVGTEATLDKKRLIFYFTSEGRIDFRDLVRDLASKFRTRIEMRQIGVRDEVKFIGGIGMCGREVCCKTFLTSFEPISIRMAKKQELVLNPGKLSGVCGRLMCCLGYEIEQPTKEEIITVETEDKAIVVTGESIIEEEKNTVENFLLSIDTPQPSVPKHRDKEPIPLSQRPDKPEEQKPRDKKTESYIPESKDKGKPFSRRKKFFKKKKRP